MKWSETCSFMDCSPISVKNLVYTTGCCHVSMSFLNKLWVWLVEDYSALDLLGAVESEQNLSEME